MRRSIGFTCEGAALAGTLDDARGTTGLLIVSGGNEIRAGAHRGQALLAANIAAQGFPVFRFDRRGIGDSEGDNGGFKASGPDIAAALAAFASAAPHVRHIVAFGNCDAATALALYDGPALPCALILSNPWVIDGEENGTPSPQAVRARYWRKLGNPRALWSFLNSDLNLGKLGSGLKTAAQRAAPLALADAMRDKLEAYAGPVHILLASGDRTAQVFDHAFKGKGYAPLRQSSRLTVHRRDTISHSYAVDDDPHWLADTLVAILQKMDSTAP